MGLLDFLTLVMATGGLLMLFGVIPVPKRLFGTYLSDTHRCRLPKRGDIPGNWPHGAVWRCRKCKGVWRFDDYRRQWVWAGDGADRTRRVADLERELGIEDGNSLRDFDR